MAGAARIVAPGGQGFPALMTFDGGVGGGELDGGFGDFHGLCPPWPSHEVGEVGNAAPSWLGELRMIWILIGRRAEIL